MNKVKLKEKLIQKIQETENEDLLNDIMSILQSEEETSEIYKFSDKEIVGVNEAQVQIKNGQYLTHEEAKKRIDEWLNK
mgnify:CR=1 FL=1